MQPRRIVPHLDGSQDGIRVLRPLRVNQCVILRKGDQRVWQPPEEELVQSSNNVDLRQSSVWYVRTYNRKEPKTTTKNQKHKKRDETQTQTQVDSCQSDSSKTHTHTHVVERLVHGCPCFVVSNLLGLKSSGGKERRCLVVVQELLCCDQFILQQVVDNDACRCPCGVVRQHRYRSGSMHLQQTNTRPTNEPGAAGCGTIPLGRGRGVAVEILV